MSLESPSPTEFPLSVSTTAGIDYEIPNIPFAMPLLVDGQALITAAFGQVGNSDQSYVVNWLPDGGDESVFAEGEATDSGVVSPGSTLSFNREFLSNPSDDAEAAIPVEITLRHPDTVLLLDAGTGDTISETTVRVLFDPISFGVPPAQIVTSDPPLPTRFQPTTANGSANFVAASTPRQSQPVDFSSGQGNTGTRNVRRFVLRVVIGSGPSAREISYDVELNGGVLNLNDLFQLLPDDHYRLYLSEGETRRLIKDFVLQGHRELEEQVGADDTNDATGAKSDTQQVPGEATDPESASVSTEDSDDASSRDPIDPIDSNGQAPPQPIAASPIRESAEERQEATPPETPAPPPPVTVAAATAMTAAAWAPRIEAALEEAVETGKLSRTARLARRGRRRRA